MDQTREVREAREATLETLAGAYQSRDLEVLRQVLSSAEKPIGFSHREDVMVFKQLMVLAGPDEAVEMEGPLVGSG